jgi:hypothetical protein
VTPGRASDHAEIPCRFTQAIGCHSARHVQCDEGSRASSGQPTLDSCQPRENRICRKSGNNASHITQYFVLGRNPYNDGNDSIWKMYVPSYSANSPTLTHRTSRYTLTQSKFKNPKNYVQVDTTVLEEGTASSVLICPYGSPERPPKDNPQPRCPSPVRAHPCPKTSFLERNRSARSAKALSESCLLEIVAALQPGVLNRA